MGAYIEQSQKMFQQMQENMQEQTRKHVHRLPVPASTPAKTAEKAGEQEVVGGATKKTKVAHRSASSPSAAPRPRRFRAHPDAPARRGLRDLRQLRRRRSGGGQYLRLHRCRGGGIARRHRRGAGRERQGHRHRLPRRQEGASMRRASAHPQVLAVTGPHAHEEVMDGGARASAAAARPVRRPGAAAGHQADAASTTPI